MEKWYTLFWSQDHVDQLLPKKLVILSKWVYLDEIIY